MERISILGTSGSGKTTLARHLAASLDIPHLELDSVFHQPGWTPRPDVEFRATVAAFCEGDRWVVCGKYPQVRDLVLTRADTAVCLDHNRVRQTLRVAWRTARRSAAHTELWNGNRETWRSLWPFPDGERSIVRWTWDDMPRSRALFDSVTSDPTLQHLDVIRLHGWPAIDRWQAALPS